MAKRNAAGMAKLSDWMDRFETVASPQFQAAQTRELSDITLKEIERGFQRESTPYGQKWRPKKRPNGEQILVERDRMRRRFKARLKKGSFEITNPQPYTQTHQHGDASRNIPRRQMWPDPNRLPAKWIKSYTRATQDRFFRVIQNGAKS